jgi:hypothetical protein
VEWRAAGTSLFDKGAFIGSFFYFGGVCLQVVKQAVVVII